MISRKNKGWRHLFSTLYLKNKQQQQKKLQIPQLFYFCEVMHEMNNWGKIKTIEAITSKVRESELNKERSTTEKDYLQLKF